MPEWWIYPAADGTYTITSIEWSFTPPMDESTAAEIQELKRLFDLE